MNITKIPNFYNGLSCTNNSPAFKAHLKIESRVVKKLLMARVGKSKKDKHKDKFLKFLEDLEKKFEFVTNDIEGTVLITTEKTETFPYVQYKTVDGTIHDRNVLFNIVDFLNIVGNSKFNQKKGILYLLGMITGYEHNDPEIIKITKGKFSELFWKVHHMSDLKFKFLLKKKK